MNARTTHIQLRLSPQEKAAIKAAARAAGLDMSDWIRTRLLPAPRLKFAEVTRNLAKSQDDPAARRYALAAVHDFLSALHPSQIEASLAAPPVGFHNAFAANYLAALVEQLCAKHGARVPDWTRYIEPLSQPYFATDLASLRLHLLRNSPPPFRSRNLFVDTGINGRV